MTKNVMQRFANLVGSRRKRSVAVLKKINGAHVKLAIVAAALFILAYAVETKAILALELSHNLFEVMR